MHASIGAHLQSCEHAHEGGGNDRKERVGFKWNAVAVGKTLEVNKDVLTLGRHTGR